jgi:hypothetical protein
MDPDRPEQPRRFFTILGKVIVMMFALVVGLVGLALTVCGLLLPDSTAGFHGMLLIGLAAVAGAIMLIVWALRGV